ncbi:MAG TPA: hypothetical protein VKR58_12470, partial [Aquella sp.]|nr:hypothetical protein [Aquella sp.]
MKKVKQCISALVHNHPDLTYNLIRAGIYLFLALLCAILFYFKSAEKQTAKQPWCLEYNTGREDCSYQYWYNKDFPKQSAWN